MKQYVESATGAMADLEAYFAGCWGPCRLAGLAELEAYFAGCWGPCRLAGLAFMFSVGILMQILGCALYNNWWPMLSALMYVMVPMPCLFFGGGSSTDFIMMSGEGDWMDAAKFLTGFSAVGSIAIPAILHHAKLIELGAMLLELLSFAILLCTVIVFQRVNQEDDYGWS